MIEGHLDVCLAILTYRRPALLGRLLSEMERLRTPEDCTVKLVVIDNDPEGSAEVVVNAFFDRLVDLDVAFLIENEPGIPAARNRALDEGIASGFDLLCFTDDDAWPRSDWLLQLLHCYRQSGANLIFGPQRLCRPPDVSSMWKGFIARSLEERSRFVERFSESESHRGRIATSGTYNWMGDLRWIAREGIRFDTEMKFTGGSDTAFRECSRMKGALMTWCSQAIIYEEIPDERLTVRYQFRRARMQGMNSLHYQRPVHPAILRHPIGRIVAGISLLAVPVLGFASFSLGLHQIGMGVGILQARRGASANLYSR